MIVKFIVTKDKKVFFGTDWFSREYHSDIAKANRVPEENIAGGGVANFENKIIYGNSRGFGPYDQAIIQELLPDWDVRPPKPII